MPQVLEKSPDILEIFLEIDHPREFSLTELAEFSGLNIATVSRILSILVKRGYLRQPEKRGKYSLGMKFLDFTGLIKGRIKLRDVAFSFVVKLSREVDESVILSSWDGIEGIHIATVNTNHLLKIVPEEGTRFSLYSTGIGKAILANVTDDEFERYVSSNTLKGHTPKTITDITVLKKHLRMVKRGGVAFDSEEQYQGISNVASVFKDNEGNISGAVGVLGPSVRLTRTRMEEIAPAVKRCALEISKALGYEEEDLC